MKRVGPIIGRQLMPEQTSDAATSETIGPDESSGRTDLVARLDRLRARAALEERARPKTGSDVVSAAQPGAAKQRSPRVQMPLWSEHHRPVLHDLVRSALFTCRQKDPRADFKAHVVASVDNVRITYTGQELRQRDLDVYLQVLHAARGLSSESGDEWVEFDARAFVKALRWTQNRRSQGELREAIRRMQACGLEVSSRRESGPPTLYGGPLVLEYAGVGGEFDETVLWRVRLNPRIAAMFRPGNYARINWEARARLSPLGKWLQAFYSTNVQPFPMKVETLKRLSGSTANELKAYREVLRDALGDLVTAGVLHRWHIDADDKVHVLREAPATALPDE